MRFKTKTHYVNGAWVNHRIYRIDHAFMPEISYPALDARSCQKISVLSDNRTTSQQSCLISKTFNSLLSAKKLTEQSQWRPETGDEVMMIKKEQSLLHVSMLRLHLMNTNTSSSVKPNCFTTTSHKPWISINILSYLLFMKTNIPWNRTVIRLNNNGNIKPIIWYNINE